MAHRGTQDMSLPDLAFRRHTKSQREERTEQSLEKDSRDKENPDDEGTSHAQPINLGSSNNHVANRTSRCLK